MNRSSSASTPLPNPAPEPQRPALQKVEPPAHKRSFVWLWLLIPVVAASAWYALRTAQPAQVATAPARKVRVVRGTLDRTLRITGVTLAARTANLRAPQMTGRRSGGGGASDFGLVVEQLSRQGAHVKKGDVVAAFDQLNMATRLDDYKALRKLHENSAGVLRSNLNMNRHAHLQRIRAAKGKLDKAALDLKTAPVLALLKLEKLRVAHAEAQSQYQSLVDQADILDESQMASIRYTELDLKEAAMEERRAQKNLDGMIVRAPVDGITLAGEIFRGSENSQIQEGDELSPGQLFMRVDDPASMIVEASANQADIQDLHMGARAQVMFEAYPGLELPARLYSIDPITSGARYRPAFVKKVRVRLKLDRLDPRVISDLTVNADVVLESAPDATIVPMEAISEDPKTGKSYAMVEEGGTWKRKDVELGMHNNTSVAVTGLEEGAMVAAGAFK